MTSARVAQSQEIARHLASSLPAHALHFASIHLYDPGDSAISAFYPASGASDGLFANVINVPIAPIWRRAPAKSGRGTGAQSPRIGGSGRLEWRAAFSQRIIPALRAFSPELLLLSSGFDAAATDVGNSKMDSSQKYHQVRI